MDGAVEAGERAAREVLNSMGIISKEEIYQEEPPSIEVPPVSCGLTRFQSNLPSVPTFLVALTVLCFGSAAGFTILKYKTIN